MARRPIAVLGDSDYVAHGGMVVYDNGDGDYVDPWTDGEHEQVDVYGVLLDKVEEPSREWFGDRLAQAAKSVDMPVADLAAALNSDDVVRRASAYAVLIGYFGAIEFDHEPVHLTPAAAERRFRAVDRALARPVKTKRK